MRAGLVAVLSRAIAKAGMTKHTTQQQKSEQGGTLKSASSVLHQPATVKRTLPKALRAPPPSRATWPMPGQGAPSTVGMLGTSAWKLQQPQQGGGVGSGLAAKQRVKVMLATKLHPPQPAVAAAPEARVRGCEAASALGVGDTGRESKACLGKAWATAIARTTQSRRSAFALIVLAVRGCWVVQDLGKLDWNTETVRWKKRKKTVRFQVPTPPRKLFPTP